MKIQNFLGQVGLQQQFQVGGDEDIDLTSWLGGGRKYY